MYIAITMSRWHQVNIVALAGAHIGRYKDRSDAALVPEARHRKTNNIIDRIGNLDLRVNLRDAIRTRGVGEIGEFLKKN
jgi:hypothetical protein